MPIFEYRCDKCGYVSQFLERPDSRKRHVCQKCGSKGMTKLLSVFGTVASKKTSASTDTSCPTGTCPLS